jgi:integrase
LGQVDHLLPATNGDVLFCDFAEKWITEYCEIEKAETQWVEDRAVCRNHLIPAFGNISLSSLQKTDLNELKFRLQKSKKPGKQQLAYAPKTINNIIGLAKKMMNTGVEWGLITVNPFRDVKKLKIREQDFDYWRPEERDAFLEQCYQHDLDFADAVLIACHTGLRLGELAGLPWSAIDFSRKTFSVKNTYCYKLKKEFNRTKTHDKAVHLPMNELLIDVLKRRQKQAAGPSVFSQELLQDACKKLQARCSRYGVREIRFHDLRHTFASSLAMAGVDLMVIKELMRHKSYQMTLRYAHLHPDHLRGATDVLAGRGQIFAHAQKVGKMSCPRTAHETQNAKVLSFASAS